MKPILVLFLFFTTFSLTPVSSQTTQRIASAKGTFSNPLKVQFGDPFVLYTGGTYYMYGTGGGADKGFAAYSSKDLVNWKHEGQVYFHNNINGWSDPEASWGGAYWAPEVYEVKGTCYLFYSPHG